MLSLILQRCVVSSLWVEPTKKHVGLSILIDRWANKHPRHLFCFFVFSFWGRWGVLGFFEFFWSQCVHQHVPNSTSLCPMCFAQCCPLETYIDIWANYWDSHVSLFEWILLLYWWRFQTIRIFLCGWLQKELWISKAPPN
jgi:hypothetical protein